MPKKIQISHRNHEDCNCEISFSKFSIAQLKIAMRMSQVLRQAQDDKIIAKLPHDGDFMNYD